MKQLCLWLWQEERKRRKEEEEAKKKEERLRKTAEFEKWKNPPKRNFVITKKAEDEGEKDEVLLHSMDVLIPRDNQHSRMFYQKPFIIPWSLCNFYF